MKPLIYPLSFRLSSIINSIDDLNLKTAFSLQVMNCFVVLCSEHLYRKEIEAHD
jgi:hypothetical protein